MSGFKLEKEMTPFFTSWLEDQGFEVIPEQSMYSGICDLVGFRWGERIGRPIPPLLETVTLELKLKKVGEVFHQAHNNYFASNRSWVGIPMGVYERARPQTRGLFLGSGVGILEIHPRGWIQEILPARSHDYEVSATDQDRKRYWRLVNRWRKRKVISDGKSE